MSTQNQLNNNFKCKECGMSFDDITRLDRHFKKAHPHKYEGYTQKWYWEN